MELEARLRQLEQQVDHWQRQHRRSRRRFAAASAGLVLLCLVLAWMVGQPLQAQQDTKAGPLQVTNLTLVDNQGKKHAELASTQNGPLLTFFKDNKETLIMGLNNGDPGMIFKQDGTTTMKLFSSASAKLNTSTLNLRDPKSKANIDIFANKGEPKVVIKDASGKQTWATP